MRTPKQGGGRRFRPAESPPTCPNLDQLCAHADILRVVEWERLWEKASCQNLETTKAVSRRSTGVGEQRIKASISRLRKEQAQQRRKKKLSP